MKIIGRYWNDNTMDVVEIDGEMYVLNGWNGDSYNHCWKVLDAQGLESAEDNREYVLTPIYEEVNEGDYKIINYIVD